MPTRTHADELALLKECERLAAENPPAENRHLVLVYGTLRFGFGLHTHALGSNPDVEFVGERVLEGWALVELGSFPGAFPMYGRRTVCELYRVPESVLVQLDSIEGSHSPERPEANHYTRVRVPTGERDENAWVYRYEGFLMKPDDVRTVTLPLVPRGDYGWKLARVEAYRKAASEDRAPWPDEFEEELSALRRDRDRAFGRGREI